MLKLSQFNPNPIIRSPVTKPYPKKRTFMAQAGKDRTASPKILGPFEWSHNSLHNYCASTAALPGPATVFGSVFGDSAEISGQTSACQSRWSSVVLADFCQGSGWFLFRTGFETAY